jgi:hypothetical protein
MNLSVPWVGARSEGTVEVQFIQAREEISIGRNREQGVHRPDLHVQRTLLDDEKPFSSGTLA